MRSGAADIVRRSGPAAAEAGRSAHPERRNPLKIYLLSLAAGILVGVIYALINVRSPAPPVVALLGLLGMLVGEQVVPVARHWWAGKPLTISWLQKECSPHVLGTLPVRSSLNCGPDPTSGPHPLQQGNTSEENQS